MSHVENKVNWCLRKAEKEIKEGKKHRGLLKKDENFEEYRELTYSTVTFEKYAGCGVNCSIMPGVTLAEGSILGANSLLTKDTEPWTIYVGSPAKPVKIRDKDKIIKYASKLKNDNR
jgi:acetyltransferase-like isoleucine patch superfamily enzyme